MIELFSLASIASFGYKQIVQEESNESYNETRLMLVKEINNTLRQFWEKLDEQTLKIQHFRELLIERETIFTTNNNFRLRISQDKIISKLRKDLKKNIAEAKELEHMVCALTRLQFKLKWNLQTYDLKGYKKIVDMSNERINK